MNTVTTQTSKKSRKLGTIVLTAVLAGLIGGLASVPARADNDDHGRNVQQERHDKVRHPVHHVSHMDNRYVAPSYVYAPPPVYYVAPARQPAVDFVFPLNFR
jgi:hypothetical protein